jgi:uncharacterized protein (UPF0332 family)
MDDKRIIAIREKVLKEFDKAEENYESAVLLFESDKYRTCIRLFKDSIMSGTKALLMLSHDKLPADSALIETYHQTEISKELKLDIELNEIITKLKNAEKDSFDPPLSRKSIKDLDICAKQIENYLTRANRLIKRMLLTKKEIEKKQAVRKLVVASSAVVVAVLVLAKIISILLTLGNGLTGRYFADQKFEKYIKTRKDRNINFDWNLGPIIEDYYDNVSVIWDGKIKAPRNGEYGFTTRSDDGVRLWIDDKLIIDDWRKRAVEDHSNSIYLEKGTHDIKIEYFDAGLHAVMKLLWTIPGTRMPKVIPASQFKPSKEVLTPDSYQGESNFPVGEIVGGIEIGQTFYCDNNNLARIKVMLATYNRRNYQDIIFHLKASPTEEKDIYTETFNASGVADDEYKAFDFPPIPDSKGKTFYFSFESPGSKTGDAITLWATNEDKYEKGAMYKNGEKLTGDVRFFTYYIKNK